MRVGDVWKLGTDGRWHFRWWSLCAWRWFFRTLWRESSAQRRRGRLYD
jgi:hypothetical protein